MKKIAKLLVSRMFIVILLMLLQFGILIDFIYHLSQYFVYLYAALTLLSLVVVIRIVNKDIDPGFKLAWSIVILLVPIFGGLFYMIFGTNGMRKSYIRGYAKVHQDSAPYRRPDPAVEERLRALDHGAANQSHYISAFSGYPLCDRTTSHYFPSGEAKFEALKVELQKARHFIFLEYFILEEGVMWNSILEILTEKAAAGVDVRVIYDDIGSLQTLPYRYDEELRRRGIRCAVFNPFRPVLSIRLNNRDHRKIVVIDGNVGFTGGINLADEYINVTHPHGHWKDTAVILRGEAVRSLTVMFLETWDFIHHTHEDYGPYMPGVAAPSDQSGDGFVQVYGDSPLDDERVGEYTYLDIINQAQDYVYITSPYLIVGNEMMTALELAAKRGVDVRLMTPGIPDKKYVYLMTRASYEPLIRAGVALYEYTPGFIHAKSFVSDDEIAVVGTINLDYRSFYHHFENGVWFYRAGVVAEVRQDFLETQQRCHRVTLEDCRKMMSLPSRLALGLMRVFAPLF